MPSKVDRYQDLNKIFQIEIMFRVGVRNLTRTLYRAEGDVPKGSDSFRKKEKAIEDQWIKQQVFFFFFLFFLFSILFNLLFFFFSFH